MDKQVDFDKYTEFVNAVTSEESKYGGHFQDRLRDLYSKDFNTHRALTAALGLSAESGEFTEIVKKIVFQGKEVDDDTKKHLKSEHGDICWYMAQALIALESSWEEVFDINVGKLSDRYPGGFDALKSASRKVGDI